MSGSTSKLLARSQGQSFLILASLSPGRSPVVAEKGALPVSGLLAGIYKGLIGKHTSCSSLPAREDC